eukprot:31307-Pelagococcus_subviridis.AAC.12
MRREFIRARSNGRARGWIPKRREGRDARGVRRAGFDARWDRDSARTLCPLMRCSVASTSDIVPRPRSASSDARGAEGASSKSRNRRRPVGWVSTSSDDG